MLTVWQNFIVVVLIVSSSLLFMWALNRVWAWEKRHAHNNLIGWQLSILGTTYAVILGFMLYTVWSNFGVANLNVDDEANALGNVYRLAQGLPDPQRGQLEVLASSYADTVINQDMWKTLMSVKDGTPTQIIAEDHALSELSALTEHRRTRLLQNVFRIPTVLWFLLITGGVVNIASTAMFGSGNRFLHTLQVFAFSLIIALALTAIADIDRPFQGAVRVMPVGFERARATFAEFPPETP